MSKRIQELIEHMQGTCKDFITECEDLGINPDSLIEEEMTEFDDALFRCDCCGWWYESRDERLVPSYDKVCYNCVDYYDEEEYNEDDE